MDSNDSEYMRVEDAAAAEERTRPLEPAPQAAGGEAAAPGCLSNTRGRSSPIEMQGYPEHRISGGIDWFEWKALIHWENAERFQRAIVLLQQAKLDCQALQQRHFPVLLPDFGPVKVRRVGANSGGDRGQHFEYSLRIAGVDIGLSPRDIAPDLNDRDLAKTQPNFTAKQTGRDCLLVGALEGFEMAEALITALGGKPIAKRISRGDLCLDIVNLDAAKLLAIVKEGCFVTRAGSVVPYGNLVTDHETGFAAGTNPLHVTVYDKVREQFGKTDALYLRALVDRRWGGEHPDAAARIEIQTSRPWLRDHGIDSPEDFLRLRGSLCEKLTHDWLRLTVEPVDRENKHQSRAATHPLWFGIQKGFEAIFGPPEGFLEPLERRKVEPIELARQGRGCLLNCLLQIGEGFSTYGHFVKACAKLLLDLFPSEHERTLFLKEAADRQMEYEVS